MPTTPIQCGHACRKSSLGFERVTIEVATMKPVRVPIANNAEDADAARKVTASPKFFSNLFSDGRQRRPSMSGESRGCLSLLDAEEQMERPRAFPSPGLSGEILPSHSLKVHAHPTVHIHRPRAVLSSPENDELQAQKLEKSATSNRTPQAPAKDLPNALLSSVDVIDPSSLSKEVPKAIVSPPDEFLYMGDLEASISDEASSCSTSSNLERNHEFVLTHDPSNEVHVRIPPSETSKESRHEQSGNEEQLIHGAAANRSAKQQNGSNVHHRPPKQVGTRPGTRLSSTLRSTKDHSGKVLRPWY